MGFEIGKYNFECQILDIIKKSFYLIDITNFISLEYSDLELFGYYFEVMKAAIKHDDNYILDVKFFSSHYIQYGNFELFKRTPCFYYFNGINCLLNPVKINSLIDYK